MRFLLMGPVEAWQDDRRIDLRGSKVTSVLALFLLARGRVVSDAVLGEMLWGEEPPGTAQSQIQTYVSRLRGLLGSEVEIDRQRPGYRFRFPSVGLDLLEFEQHVARGRVLMGERRLEEAAENFQHGLALWRGPALAGVSEHLASVEAPRLEESRMVAVEDRIEAELMLGRHAALISELKALVVVHPHRERPRTQLMLALYRCGRQVEALRTYQDYRSLLIEDLGLEPGRQLQEIHQAILIDDQRIQLETIEARQVPEQAVRPVHRTQPASSGWRLQAHQPAQLPPVPMDFTGREREVEQMAEALRVRSGESGSPSVCAIVGMAGTGKSVLAAQVAHRIRDEYPDGQIHLDLGGNGPHPITPAEAVTELLRTLGVVDMGSDRLPELIRIYRSQVAERRLLIMLDDAKDEQQIRPLLPATDKSGVLITSRHSLAALEGVRRMQLGAFSSEEAVQLLSHLIGAERVANEPQAAARIVALGGYLPLAVRISGARLARRPHWSLGRLAKRLADSGSLLDELELGDLGVRRSLVVSHNQLPTCERRALELLAQLGTGPFSLRSAAVLLETSDDAALDLIDTLIDAHLLASAENAPDRYQFHRLTWALAWERGGEERSAVPVSHSVVA
ncbi:BTAD domain-containing putative transcriptional regulator [Kitasatospora sp. NPDC059327]|uniref:AfsR/SARP family transcriptional regulator n=1 Tax=Kitasatospora sp. NPDC059327 TaxID=3346803 RepID=UPI0036983B82